MKPTRLANNLSWTIGFILALMPFHAFITVWLSSFVGHYTLVRLWKEILLMIISAGMTYILVKDKRLRKEFLSSRLNQLMIIYCLVLLAWGAGAYILHKVTAKALGFGLIIDLRFVVFFMAVSVVVAQSPWLKERWLKLILWPALVVTIIGLAQRFFLPYDVLRHFGYNDSNIYPYETINHNVHYPRIMSTLRGANPLGAYLILILTVLAVKAKNVKKHRNVLIGFAAVAFFALIFSYSRAAWAGLVFSLLALVWAGLKSERTKRAVLIIISASLVVLAGLVIALRNNLTIENAFLHTDKQSTAKISSNQGHVSAFKSGVRDIVHQPQGRGVGTAGPASVYNKAPARIAENYFLQISQETGWLGLILFIATCSLTAKSLWLRRQDNLALALLASLVGLSLVNLVSHAWSDDTIAYIWWGLAGIALAPALNKKPKA